MALPLPPTEEYAPPSAADDWRRVRETWLGSLIFAVILAVEGILLNLTPRNSDNSMKAEVLVPAAWLALAAAIIVLRRIRTGPVRRAAWLWAFTSGAIALCGTVYVLVQLAQVG